MSTMQISGKLPFLHGENAAGKAQNAKPNTVTEVLNRAVEVYISAKGKSLSESAAMEEDLTPAEAALAANDKELSDKKAKKAQAAEIEQRIHRRGQGKAAKARGRIEARRHDGRGQAE